jgi:uncharacterized NAD(P)/FAD-binding protein YdhS
MHPGELPPADILKVDTENCEREILDHYRHLSQVKAVMLEYHSPDDYTHFIRWLPAQGFTLVRDVSKGKIGWDQELIYTRRN